MLELSLAIWLEFTERKNLWDAKNECAGIALKMAQSPPINNMTLKDQSARCCCLRGHLFKAANPTLEEVLLVIIYVEMKT